jgi:hypothetical protein
VALGRVTAVPAFGTVFVSYAREDRADVNGVTVYWDTE